MDIRETSFQYGGHTVTLETGGIARQATGSVLISMGDTMLLVTCVAKKEAKEGLDFFPLTVNYQEKFYASGKIPGGYLKREGRPSEKETLTSRLIDRPIRPLFPEGFKNEVQIVATVLSMDPEVQTDIVALLGTSAAIALSGVPFNGPIGAARVGYKDGQYILNPSQEALENSDLDLVVAGTKEAVLMVESEAKMLSEEVMLGAVQFGHDQMQTAIDAIKAFADANGKPAWDWQAPAKPTALIEQIKSLALDKLTAAYQIKEKQARYEAIGAATDAVVAELIKEGDDNAPSESDVRKYAHELESDIVRSRILAGEPRIDGRDTKTVRPLSIELGVLPRAHGSAIFTRGETQALVVTTLGTERDSQMIDSLEGTTRDEFMLHYNFPPYCVGEVGMMGSPKRREIGHGKLAKRALMAAVPGTSEFPYTLRVVSEVTESNGSSSMATVCGSTLSMMDAGVTLKAPIAGIAMGLIKEGDQHAVLTDILGDEDHLGDMDFKVAGSKDGVTALQMDIKINGITTDIMKQALAQARDARLHILNIMQQAISEPRQEISMHAPRLIRVKVPQDKIRDVIGKGGATIKQLTEETNTSIDISEDGVVTIAAVNAQDGEEAKRRVEQLTADLEIGQIYQGKITKMMDFGAIVEIFPGKDGMLHISQIREERVENIHDELSEGQELTVKMLERDRQGRVKFTMIGL